MNNKASLFLTLLILILSCGVKNSLDSSKNFTLPTLTGELVTLSKLKKKVIILDFWATWCPPCRLLIPHLNEIYKKYKDRGVVVLGIGLDEKTALLKAQDELKITYPVLIGQDKVAKDYEVEAIPTLFIFDQRGKIQLKKVGFSEEAVKEIKDKVEELISQR